MDESKKKGEEAMIGLSLGGGGVKRKPREGLPYEKNAVLVGNFNESP